MRVLAAILLFMLLALPATPTLAHSRSQSTLNVRLDGEGLAVEWGLAVHDLDYAVGLDRDLDGAVTWAEIIARRDAIIAYSDARIRFTLDGRRCGILPGGLLADTRQDSDYLIRRFRLECGGPGRGLEIGYGMLFHDLRSDHRALVAVMTPAGASSTILSPDHPADSFALVEPPSRNFMRFLLQGFEHVLTGIDHMLFLAVLLVPAVLERWAGRWKPAPRFWPAFGRLALVLTAFTLAHAATLTSAALGVVELPSRLVESLVAATIILTGFDNLFGLVLRQRWLIAIGFGLIHGLAFAASLQPLSLPPADFAVTLLGFNLGVEGAQIGLALLVLPVTWSLRRAGWFPPLVVGAGSWLAIAIAVAWLAERALDLDLLPF